MKPLTRTAATDISDILSRPEDFVGQRVLITGEIADVCQKKGCWIDVVSDNKKIRVKVKNDVMVFPVTAKGKIGMVEGEVEKLELSEEQLIEKKTRGRGKGESSSILLRFLKELLSTGSKGAVLLSRMQCRGRLNLAS